MLAHVMKVQSYDKIKDNFDKAWHEGTIFSSDIIPNDILDEDLHYERFIDEKIKFETERKRFEIDFPFKDYHDLLVDNYTNYKKRLKNLSQKLNKNEKLLKDYNDIFKEQHY